MKIRVISKVPHNDGFLFPGDVADIDAKLAEKWIEQDKAIRLQDEEPIEKPKAKRAKAGE